MTLINHIRKTVAGIRAKKLGELKAGPDPLVGIVKEGFPEEVTSKLKMSQSFLSQRMLVPGQVIQRVYRARLSRQPGGIPNDRRQRSRKAASEATASPQPLSPLPL